MNYHRRMVAIRKIQEVIQRGYSPSHIQRIPAMSQRTRTQAQQHQQSVNQVHPDYASVENEDGVTFSKGNMRVNGNYQVPTAVRNWESSNGLTSYTTVLWEDPPPATGEKRVSCNCPAWINRKSGKLRQCKHTDDMMGIKPCTANSVEGTPTRVTTIREAERLVPKFEGRELRGIMLD